MIRNLQLISRLDKPVLTPSESIEGFDVHSHYTIYENGIYYMYYNFPHHSGLRLATSKDGEHFERQNIVLGDKERKIWKCRVIRISENDWEMWYGRVRSKRFLGKKTGVGCAISKNGRVWRNLGSIIDTWGIVYDFTPIRGKEGVFNALYYDGENGGFLCSSYDGYGIIWERNKLVFAPQEAWEHKTVSPKCLQFVNGEYVLSYEAGEVGKYSIGLAYSKDLIHWQRDKRNPILKPREGFFDERFVADGSLIFLKDELRIYYGAKDNEGVGTVGLAIFKT